MALLDGLLHCYTPSLGPTGYRLIDRGPRRIHGVALSGIVSSSWVGQKNGWCLRATNAANEYFSGCGTFPTGDRTVAIWWRAQVTLPQFTGHRCIFAAGNAVAGQHFWLVMFNGVAGTGATIAQGNDSINTAFGNDNLWHCIIGTNTGSTWAIYGDGLLLGSKTMTTTQATTAPTILGESRAIYWEGDAGECVSWNRLLSPTEIRDVFRRGDGGIGRMLTGQAYPQARRYFVPAVGGATPWLYARRMSRIIGGGVS